MTGFWAGFEKKGASLIGEMPNITSGLRQYQSKGVIKAPKPPVPGESNGPRSTPVPLPTPHPQAGAAGFAPVTKRMPQPLIPRPKRQHAG